MNGGLSLRAGYCSECQANVWLNEDGTCAHGHAASEISNIYEPERPPAPHVTPVRKEVPRWAAAVWGLVLSALTVFELVYIILFTIGFASFTSGPSTPVWVDDLMFSGQLFGAVGAATLLSFAFMGLSLLHVFAWSGLPIERKVVWAAVVFAGMQPGMLVYWFMNVWRQERPREDRRDPIPDTAMKRVGLVVLGIITVLPLVYFAVFFITIGWAAEGGQVPGILDAIPIMHMGVIFLWWTLTAVYLIDVLRTPRLEGSARAIWAALVAFGGPLAWPIYWYLNMWRRVPDTAPASA